jgi:methylated-DNA-[protein]-cysteine S-methyltransferase
MGPSGRHRRAAPRGPRDRYAAAARCAAEPATFPASRSTLTGIPAFNQRVYSIAQGIPRGETRTYAEVASVLRVSGAVYSVAQAIARNPFMIIVPCHRVLEAGNYADKITPNGGAISKRRRLAIEGAHPTSSKTLFDVLLPVAPPRAHN